MVRTRCCCGPQPRRQADRNPPNDGQFPRLVCRSNSFFPVTPCSLLYSPPCSLLYSPRLLPPPFANLFQIHFMARAHKETLCFCFLSSLAECRSTSASTARPPGGLVSPSLPQLITRGFSAAYSAFKTLIHYIIPSEQSLEGFNNVSLVCWSHNPLREKKLDLVDVLKI